MYFHCLFFHTTLTVAQNTQRANFTIIPECHSVNLVVFLSVPPLVCSEHPYGDNTESIHPTELFILQLLFHSKLYSGGEYTNTVLSFGFILLALIINTCI